MNKSFASVLEPSGVCTHEFFGYLNSTLCKGVWVECVSCVGRPKSRGGVGKSKWLHVEDAKPCRRVSVVHSVVRRCVFLAGSTSLTSPSSGHSPRCFEARTVFRVFLTSWLVVVFSFWTGKLHRGRCQNGVDGRGDRWGKSLCLFSRLFVCSSLFLPGQ